MNVTPSMPQQKPGAAPAPEPEAARPWLSRYPAGVDWSAVVPERPVFELLDAAAARFAELHDLANRAAKGLQGLGVGPGAKVGLLLPNCPYFPIFYFAALKAGATLVNYNPLYAEAELAAQVEDSETSVMVTIDAAPLAERAAALLARTRLRHLVLCPMAEILPTPRRWLLALALLGRGAALRKSERVAHYRDLVANDGTFAPVAIAPRDSLALLQYTGGTTGLPKGAMLTHANVYANAVQCGHWFTQAVPGEERVVGVLPLFHAFAMTAVMNWSLLAGAEMILLPRFNLRGLLAVIERKRPTTLAAVPTLLTAIIGSERGRRIDFRSLKLCISGGAPLPVQVKRAFEALAGCPVVEGYGLSECSPVVCCNPVSGGKEASAGVPYPGTVIEIVAPDNPRRRLPPGQTGEICVRGPQVMAGYWKRPEETAKVLIEGRLHTGDIGYLDAEGYLFVTDRLKDMVNVGGYKVYPRVVEEALHAHPGVAECAVFGVPDAYRGEVVKAVIVPAAGAGLTPEDLDAYLADKLSPMERPKLIAFSAALPKTAVGKIDKKALRALHRPGDAGA